MLMLLISAVFVALRSMVYQRAMLLPSTVYVPGVHEMLEVVAVAVMTARREVVLQKKLSNMDSVNDASGALVLYAN